MLSLSRNEFVATVPTEIGLLSNLRQLELAANALTGALPNSISSLDLTVLSVEDNRLLTGQVLEYIDSWPNMEYLHIVRTSITGTLPESIGALTNLRGLFVGPNINGTIPNSFANLTSLDDCSLTGPGLKGTIPSNIRQLTNLGRLSYFSFSSPLNVELICSYRYRGYISSCTEYFYVANTGLQGTIPPTAGELPLLSELIIDATEITGTIPSELGNLSRLTRLHLVSEIHKLSCVCCR